VSDALIDEIIFGSAQGARRSRCETEPLVVSVVRALTEDDIPALTNPPLTENVSTRQPIQNITYAHHSLAQLIVQGKPIGEVSLITGYSPSYVHGLQRDPAFKELLDYYGQHREKVFVDALERMKALGLATLDELQRRLVEEPDSFARRELMELSELMLIKGAKAGPGGPVGAGGQSSGGHVAGTAVAVTVKFVSSQPEILPSPSPVLELSPTESQR
jgi:hypothetical protein